MIRTLLTLLTLALVFTSFKPPGSGTAHLTCISESGQTKFNARLQDIVGVLENAEFIIDKQKIQFSDEMGDEAVTIFDPKSGVFTIHISGQPNSEFPNSRFIEFWAIPSTFKIISSNRADQLYEFKAKIVATEPRKNRHLRTPEIILSCRLKYKI